MADLIATTMEGGQTRIEARALEGLEATLRGRLLTAEAPGYDEARAVWNAMIDRRPALIARCAGAADVQHALTFARDHGLLLAIKGGGHHIAGNAVCDGGMVLDLSLMREVDVDPARRVARVAAGATLHDVDVGTQRFALATPLGINSTTGIAGLTLGGGFGWLTRRYGLTADNLRSAEVLTAEGTVVRASATSEPDLFWALRGGGGNFGVVTSFELALHPVGPEVLSGLIVHRLDDAPALLRRYRDLVAQAPDELACWVILRKAPPLPFIPAELHGREVLLFACFYAGDPAQGEAHLRTLRGVGQPVADAVSLHRYVDWQQAFDPLLTPGLRNYWKSHNFAALPDAAFDALADAASRLPTALTEIFVGQLGGAAGRVAPDAMAYPHRDAEFVMNVHTRWASPTDDARCVGWARELFAEMAPYSTGGVYVNFISEGEDRVRAAFGANHDRLAAIKQRYDPDNLFRVNQNIRPRPAFEPAGAPPP